MKMAINAMFIYFHTEEQEKIIEWRELMNFPFMTVLVLQTVKRRQKKNFAECDTCMTCVAAIHDIIHP